MLPHCLGCRSLLRVSHCHLIVRPSCSYLFSRGYTPSPTPFTDVTIRVVGPGGLMPGTQVFTPSHLTVALLAGLLSFVLNTAVNSFRFLFVLGAYLVVCPVIVLWVLSVTRLARVRVTFTFLAYVRSFRF